MFKTKFLVEGAGGASSFCHSGLEEFQGNVKSREFLNRDLGLDWRNFCGGNVFSWYGKFSVW